MTPAQTSGEVQTTTADASGEGSTAAADETTAAPMPNPFLELSECDESDLELSPMMGPAFDPETGEQLAPLEPPFVAASTVGWPKPEEEAQQILGQHSAAASEAIFGSEGLLGVSFGGSERCGSARTLSLWADMESMQAYVLGRVHAAAMDEGFPQVLAWGTTHWVEAESTEAPTWDEAIERIIDAHTP